MRDELAEILTVVARDGLPGPRDLDVALDAIEEIYKAKAAKMRDALRMVLEVFDADKDDPDRRGKCDLMIVTCRGVMEDN